MTPCMWLPSLEDRMVSATHASVNIAATAVLIVVPAFTYNTYQSARYPGSVMMQAARIV